MNRLRMTLWMGGASALGAILLVPLFVGLWVLIGLLTGALVTIQWQLLLVPTVSVVLFAAQMGFIVGALSGGAMVLAASTGSLDRERAQRMWLAGTGTAAALILGFGLLTALATPNPLLLVLAVAIAAESWLAHHYSLRLLRQGKRKRKNDEQASSRARLERLSEWDAEDAAPTHAHGSEGKLSEHNTG